jgi:hypothetical protein
MGLFFCKSPSFYRPYLDKRFLYVTALQLMFCVQAQMARTLLVYKNLEFMTEIKSGAWNCMICVTSANVTLHNASATY